MKAATLVEKFYYPAVLASAVGHVFATPALHRLHHSRRESEIDAKFGDVSILWDVLMGTRVAPRPNGVLHDQIGRPGMEVAQTYSSHLRLPFEWTQLHTEATKTR